MFKIEIKKNDVLTNYAEFATELDAQAWLEKESLNGSFGKIQREVKEARSVDSEGVETIYLENNEDISLSMSVREEEDSLGNIMRFHTLPAEFTSAITDITAQALAEKESVEALEYLKATDYLVLKQLDTGIEYSTQIKTLRAAARLKVL